LRLISTRPSRVSLAIRRRVFQVVESSFKFLFRYLDVASLCWSRGEQARKRYSNRCPLKGAAKLKPVQPATSRALCTETFRFKRWRVQRIKR
jgi:hypothetical protein